jgi:DNA polymerase III subunit delta'
VTLVGQDKAVAAFRAALDGGNLHHAWLLAGPRGVGKGTFARMAALRLLADAAGPRVQGPGLEVPDDHRIARLFAAGSHPDFRLLEREPFEETRKKDELRRNITVDQVRRLHDLFAVAPALSGWRAVVIDSIDDLERSAANALLKLLEEPPGRSLFLLVSHSPGRLLPTIRSRCRQLDFGLLSEGQVAAVLEQVLAGESGEERARLAALAGGSVARALSFAELDLAPLAEEALAILRRGDPDNSRRSRLASALALKAAAPRYTAFLDLLPPLVAAEARKLEGSRQQRAVDAYARIREAAALAPRLSLDPATTVFNLGTILAEVGRP